MQAVSVDKYIFTSSKAVLLECHKVVEKCYRDALGVEIGEIDENGITVNENEYVAVALEGEKNQCIGCGKLVISTPENPKRIPLEVISNSKSIIKNFTVCNFEDIGKYPYCEITRFAVLENYRNNGFTSRSLIEMLIDKAIQHKCKYLLGLCPTINYSKLKALFGNYGLDYQLVRKKYSFTTPFDKQLEFNLVCSDLSNLHVSNKVSGESLELQFT